MGLPKHVNLFNADFRWAFFVYLYNLPRSQKTCGVLGSPETYPIFFWPIIHWRNLRQKIDLLILMAFMTFDPCCYCSKRRTFASGAELQCRFAMFIGFLREFWNRKAKKSTKILHACKPIQAVVLVVVAVILSMVSAARKKRQRRRRRGVYLLANSTTRLNYFFPKKHLSNSLSPKRRIELSVSSSYNLKETRDISQCIDILTTF